MLRWNKKNIHYLDEMGEGFWGFKGAFRMQFAKITIFIKKEVIFLKTNVGASPEVLYKFFDYFRNEASGSEFRVFYVKINNAGQVEKQLITKTIHDFKSFLGLFYEFADTRYWNSGEALGEEFAGVELRFEKSIFLNFSKLHGDFYHMIKKNDEGRF